MKKLAAALGAAVLAALTILPASAATSWAWHQTHSKTQGGYVSVFVTKNTQRDVWWAEVVCAGGFENRQRADRDGEEIGYLGRSTAHCPRNFLPISGFLVRAGYNPRKVWPS